MKLTLFIIAVLVLCASETTASLMSLDDMKLIVDHHNYLRRNTRKPAQDERKIYWDENLAYHAKAWAERCVLKHDNFNITGEGENLAASSNPEEGLDELQKMWTAESQFFYPINTAWPPGSVVGHYRQQVWRFSNKVGCYMAVCAPGLIFAETTRYLVCRYNFIGVTTYPYTPGKPCKGCLPTDICLEGLCTEEKLEREEREYYAAVANGTDTVSLTTTAPAIPDPEGVKSIKGPIGQRIETYSSDLVLTWDDAYWFCRRYGMELWTPGSSVDPAMGASHNQFWANARRDKKNTRLWKTMNGVDVTKYLDKLWYFGYPDGKVGNDDCLYLRNDTNAVSAFTCNQYSLFYVNYDMYPLCIKTTAL